MKIVSTFVLGISAIFYIIWPKQASVDVPDNFTIQELPFQSETLNQPFNFKGYEIRPMADFTLKARILSYKYYSSDKEAELSPVDLALGWGPMSQSKVLEKIDISQRNRWYFWSTENFPITRNEIELNSANMHIIPGNEDISKMLENVKRGQIIELKGHLVECIQDGWRWKSSLTRNDTGGGACEVIFVEALQISEAR